MMIGTVEIMLWGKRIGTLHQSENDPAAIFEYDHEFQKSGIQLAPFKMPLSDRLYSFPELSGLSAFRGMPGLAADSLPDKFGNTIIDMWLRHNGRPAGSMTALERLCYTGKRGMGALEFVPAENVGVSDAMLDVTELTRLASEILSDKEGHVYRADDVTAAQMLEIGSSAGGSRAKAVIAWNENTGEVRSGQIDLPPEFSHWLIKFDNVNNNGDHGEKDGKQYTSIEYAYHLMAKDLGIDMSECRLLKKEGMSHFMTRRFDRDGKRKIFVQTLAALGHFDFNEPGACGYETYADYARRLGIGRTGIEQIFRRMAFNVVSMNCDDHVKNVSFIMDREGRWKLSPAYDLTFAYNPSNRWLKGHQMTVNGKSSDILDEDMLACGRKMNLNRTFCSKVIKETRDIVRGWPQYAEGCGISEGTIRTIDRIMNDRDSN
ncbi:MAG: type II toxin-antitoxin system HipA family toxin [Candidatus Methanomethylophilaceae archaeon]|nr:type II toxin-antitoxin system HipA family toxin [Candidatus Methanomethylophilaceae archaeon]